MIGFRSGILLSLCFLATACDTTDRGASRRQEANFRVPASAQLIAAAASYDGLLVRITIDKGTTNETTRTIRNLQVDTATNTLVGNLTLTLSAGLHNIDLAYYLITDTYGEVLIATLPSQPVIVTAHGNQEMVYDANALTYKDQDNDGFNNLRELRLGGNPADPLSHPTVSVPVANIASGSYNAALSVQLTCNSDDPSLCVAIRYSRDGSAPSAQSPLYTDPLIIDTSTELRAVAFDAEDNTSALAAFSYIIDTQAPQITTVTPADGATQVFYAQTPLRIDFSEDMNCASFNGNTFLVTTGGTPVPGQISCQQSNVMFQAHDGVLPSSAQIDAIVKGTVLDLAGNPLGADYGWRFTTQPWTRRHGTIEYEHNYAIAVDAANDILITGDTRGGWDGNTNQGGDDLFLTKFGANGAWRWTRQRGSDQYDAGIAIALDKNGNIFVAGNTEGSFDGASGQGDSDIFLMKFDATGTWQWTRLRPSPGRDFVNTVGADSNGNIIIAGTTFGGLEGAINAGGEDLFLMKFNGSGQWLWTTEDGTAGHDTVNALAVAANGDIYVGGATQGALHGKTNAGGYDMFISLYSAAGIQQWTTLRGTAQDDLIVGLVLDTQGNIVVAGNTSGSLDGNSNAGGTDIFLMQFDSKGTWQWTRQRGSSSYDNTSGLAGDGAGNLYISGSTFGSLDNNQNAGNADAVLLKFDNKGTWKWTRQNGGSGYEFNYGVAVSNDGFIYASGDTDAQGPLDGNPAIGGQDVVIYKYDATGKLQ